MRNEAKLEKDAMHVLKETSRTFYIPITLLKRELRLTVGSAYLCMRAIDEIEDHETMEAKVKEHLLRETKVLLLAEGEFDETAYQSLITPYKEDLPEVTIRLGDWINVCPTGIVRKVKEATAEMAGGMADWVKKDWVIQTKEDLDDYTYYVAGLVGVMLSDIWKWYDGTETDHDLAIGFGRGLQAVNILRNQHEDFAERGVRFIPEGWTRDDVFAYAHENLRLGDLYLQDIKTRTITLFCKIPLALAKRTLKAMEDGKKKMSRQEVEEVVAEVKNE
ncbi:squalene/phytoene synthase family protein [Pseudogracilibacillus auburnensis]|uniref:Farnesyl-diphosphate farnesyltransferase n=1 Tax=Pseudogracilibacillus auburnensis TaxID=1494959 RepID=A0A2V3W9X1_9BACI|nr:phytoene/squalene synthase family protein [Pseudogracilibacillus auburnensis]PXW85559.1 farnesyl-diphosphate farnesyltransferase [Pseudogracilibacillus auburnensis]